MMAENRLPTALCVDAVLANLATKGLYYYIPHRGDSTTGLILLKLNALDGRCKLLTQHRNFDGVLVWINALDKEIVKEQDADAYITRATKYDPDLWVIEIEDSKMNNPFEEN